MNAQQIELLETLLNAPCVELDIANLVAYAATLEVSELLQIDLISVES